MNATGKTIFGGTMPPAGEYRLMAAVLEDALDVYRRSARTPTGRRTFREIEAWFESRDRSWPFSFERICEALSLDADMIRDGLYDWRMRPLRRLFPQLVATGMGRERAAS
jgi:hypothetical protein